MIRCAQRVKYATMALKIVESRGGSMPKKKARCPQGHYCKICGEYKANEKFSGKDHLHDRGAEVAASAKEVYRQRFSHAERIPHGRLMTQRKNRAGGFR